MITPAQLYALQEIDLKIDGRKSRLAEIGEQLGETDEIRQSRNSAEENRQVLENLKGRQKESEWDVNEVKEKAGSVSDKLYGGRVRNPKELEDLQADLKSLQSVGKEREDCLLTLLLEIEEAEEAVKASEVELSAIESDWKQVQGRLSGEQDEILQDLAELERNRSDKSSGQDAGVLDLYDRLREMRGGRAVAKAEGGLCIGCRIALPMSVLKKARIVGSLTQCVSCERILYVS